MANHTGGASYKTGVVVAARPGFATVRFDDLDGLEIELPTSHKSTLGNRDAWTLDVGNQVGCILDERFEEGQIIGARYSDADVPPVDDPEVIHQDFGPSASMDFDRAAGKLTVVLGGCTFELSAAGLKVTGGDMEVEGIKFLEHKHGKVQTGTAVSDVPQ